jgi:hypothetical protein
MDDADQPETDDVLIAIHGLADGSLQMRGLRACRGRQGEVDIMSLSLTKTAVVEFPEPP